LSILSWKKAKAAGNEKMSGRFHIFAACGDKIGSIYPHCQLWAIATTGTKIFAPTDAASGQVKNICCAQGSLLPYHCQQQNDSFALSISIQSIARGDTSIQNVKESGMKDPQR
jgi:hypothetical protein